MKTCGTLKLKEGAWQIAAEPHILLRLRRVFERVSKYETGVCTLANTPENARDLEWFLQRYPLDITDADAQALASGSKSHQEHIWRLEEILDPNYAPPTVPLALPLRDYQARSVALTLAQGHLLNADDLGLGKSCQGIGVMADPRALPALVVCYPHLQRQWEAEIKKFAPSMHVHVVGKMWPYPLPEWDGRGPDVLVCTYHKLLHWWDVLAKYVRYVCFDEVQELRRDNSEKYRAAKKLAEGCVFKLGLTATPIFNYGGEMFSIMNVLAPGALGTEEEFVREWGAGRRGVGEHITLKNPKAFGSYLREHGLMLRRTRVDVGRELPPVTKIPHRVDADTKALELIEDAAGELARIILAGTPEAHKGQRMQAAEEFSNLMRQATGIAKAPYVAEFVNLLLESEPKVVLCGWHRAVYEIWDAKPTKAGRKVAYYTGSESEKQKMDAVTAFVEGDVQVLMLSLRSGSGLNRLQEVCRTIVFGELDWAPAVLDQCIGRLNRDGSLPGGVMAYFLISEEGADPVMTEVLGLKREQAEGVRDPHRELIERLETGGGHVRRLAEQYAAKKAPARAGAA